MLTNVAATTIMYSYNLDRRMICTVIDGPPSSVALADIEAELAAARAAFTGRRYQEAVDAYLAAERLISHQLKLKVPRSAGRSGSRASATGGCSSRCATCR